jgi:ribosomal protein S18 acetylase RimI-like enzyme
MIHATAAAAPRAFGVSVRAGVSGITIASSRSDAGSEDAMAFTLRDARPDDVPAIAALHVQTYNETHRGGRPGGPSYELRQQQWRESFTGRDRDWFAVVVEEDETGALVAFAKGIRHDGGVSGFDGELNKIYALKRVHRRGIGRKLLRAVAQRFVDRGMTSMLLFGEASNPTNGFYEAFGAERLYAPNGEFHGSYGWRDLRTLLARLNADDRESK